MLVHLMTNARKQKTGPKHFDDGDEWMLAEEIPDIDFFSARFGCAHL